MSCSGRIAWRRFLSPSRLCPSCVEGAGMGRHARHRHCRNGVGEKHGTFSLDFRYRGVRCKEYVNDDATAENRKKWETTLALIKAEIKAGRFDYRTWFPNGTKLAVLYPLTLAVAPLTLKEWLNRWHARR